MLAEHGPFDLILAADVLYTRQGYQPLLDTIDALSFPPNPAEALGGAAAGARALPPGKRTLTILGCPERDNHLGPGHGGRYFGLAAAAAAAAAQHADAEGEEEVETDGGEEEVETDGGEGEGAEALADETAADRVRKAAMALMLVPPLRASRAFRCRGFIGADEYPELDGMSQPPTWSSWSQ
eukprot:SAG22_NODE_260_length_13403_cov_57.915589_10_plen_182_part_00